MRQFRILRKVATVPVSGGGFATIDLPRDYDYESIFVRVNGGLQVTVLATSVRAEAPTHVIQRLEVIADGKNNLYSAPFWFSCLGNRDRPITETALALSHRRRALQLLRTKWKRSALSI